MTAWGVKAAEIEIKLGLGELQNNTAKYPITADMVKYVFLKSHNTRATSWGLGVAANNRGTERNARKICIFIYSK